MPGVMGNSHCVQDGHHAVLYISMHACLVTQLGLTLCDPMDCSPPGSAVHGDSGSNPNSVLLGSKSQELLKAMKGGSYYKEF